MYRDRLAEPGGSKLGARRHVGLLLDLNQVTLRNWIEDRSAEAGKPGGRGSDSEEVRALKKRVVELDRANEILKTSAAFSLRRSSTADSGDRGLYRVPSGPVRRRDTRA